MKAFLWMLGSLLSFSLLGIAGKELADEISIFQTLLYRSVIGIAIVIGIAKLTSENINLNTTTMLPLHFLRNTIHFCGQYLWFLGIGLLPLSAVFALEFTMPLWALLLSFIFLKEPITVKKVTAALLGFLGTIIIINPSSEAAQIESLIVLGSAVAFAITNITTKKLSQTNSVLSIMLTMCLMQTFIGITFSISEFQIPTLEQNLYLILVGIASFSAHYCLATALKLAPASQVLSIDFLRMPLISIVGFYLYNEEIRNNVIIGAAIVVLSTLLNTVNLKNFSLKKKKRTLHNN